MEKERLPITPEKICQFSELFRARELFIKLFSDKSPFTNLAYSQQQMEYALPSLLLIQNEGKIILNNYLKDDPFLSFDETMGKWSLSSVIQHLPDKQGSYLFSSRERTVSPDMSAGEKFFAIFSGPSVPIFGKYDEKVADIALFNEKAPINDLDYLVPILYKNIITDAPMNIRKEEIINKLGKKLKIAGTYQASWVDEKTKLEFVAKIETPEMEGYEPNYVYWRKLFQVKDDKGTMTPIGQKAVSSIEKIKAILDSEKSKLVFGDLSLEGQKI